MSKKNKKKQKFNNEEFEKDLEELKRCSENNDCEEFFKHYEKLIKMIAHKLTKQLNVKFKKDLVESLYHEVAIVILKDERKVLKKFEPDRGIKVSTWIAGIAFKVIYNELTKPPIGSGENGGEGGNKKENNEDENHVDDDTNKTDDNEIVKEKKKLNRKVRPIILYGLDIEKIIEANEMQESRTNIMYEIDDERINILFDSCFKNLSVLEKNIYKLSYEKKKDNEFISNFLKKTKNAVQATKSRAFKEMKNCISKKLGINQ